MTGVSWHFVGQLQTNKAAPVAAYADVVHSVDRARLVDALDRSAGRGAAAGIGCLVQVDLVRRPGPRRRGPGRRRASSRTPSRTPSTSTCAA